MADAKEYLHDEMDEWDTLKTNIFESNEHKRSEELLGNLQPLHFPIVFLDYLIHFHVI